MSGATYSTFFGTDVECLMRPSGAARWGKGPHWPFWDRSWVPALPCPWLGLDRAPWVWLHLCSSEYLAKQCWRICLTESNWPSLPSPRMPRVSYLPAFSHQVLAGTFPSPHLFLWLLQAQNKGHHIWSNRSHLCALTAFGIELYLQRYRALKAQS